MFRLTHTVEGYVKQPKYLWRFKMCFLFYMYIYIYIYIYVCIYIYIYISVSNMPYIESAQWLNSNNYSGVGVNKKYIFHNFNFQVCLRSSGE